MKRIAVIFACIASTSCGMTFPVMKTEWQPYKDTKLSSEIQLIVCEAESQVSALQLQQTLQAQYAQKRQNCLNAINSAPNTTVNVYGNNTTTSGTGLSGGLNNSARAVAAYSCNTVLTDNIQINTAVSAQKKALISSCMVGAGFTERQICVDRCGE
ncbi:MAG: hypothetical protein P8O79_02060 [Halieaceae bacterium]|nr:hypothetical protein [Halieaceae bacterium]